MKKFALGLSLVVLVAACGDDSGTTTTAGSQQPMAVSVALDDFAFDPVAVTVTAGAVVDVTATNVGGSLHSWTVLAAGESASTSDEAAAAQALVTIEADEGASATGSFTAPAPGVYQVVCTISGHLELGMEGTLVVEG